MFTTTNLLLPQEGRKFPSGEESIGGLSVTYPSASRHDSGVYICSADNGFGSEPVEQKIKLDVHRECQLGLQT